MATTGCFGPPTFAEQMPLWILLPLVIHASYAAARVLSFGMLHLVALTAELLHSG